MVSGLSLVPGGGIERGPEGVDDPVRAGSEQPVAKVIGARWRLPGGDESGERAATLAELFASSPRDGGWAGHIMVFVEAWFALRFGAAYPAAWCCLH